MSKPMKITKKNGKCIFPFLHKGKLYTKCVEGQKGKWCATEIDKKTKVMTKYGPCDNKKSIKIVEENPEENALSKLLKDSKSVKELKSKNDKKTKKKIIKKSIRKKDTEKKSVKKIIKKSIKPDQELGINNLNRLEIPETFFKYMRPQEDNLQISSYESITRKNFLNWFDLNYKAYRIRNKEVKQKEIVLVDCDKDECEQVNEDKKRELFTHQKIVRDYLNPDSPYRGIIVFHGLGVGKTCSSIAIAEGFRYDRKVVVILQKSIKNNYISQLKECGDLYFRPDNHWVFVKLDTREKKNGALKLGIPHKVISREGGCFLIDFSKKPNYDKLTSFEKDKLDRQINDMILNKYDFVHSNGLTTAQLDKLESTNYFDNKLIVIDEVHNIINGMASGGSMRAKRLNELFMAAKNPKFVFLSGTPMKNIPFEVGKIFNILKGPIDIYEIKVDGLGNKVDYSLVERILKNNNYVDQVIIKPKTKLVKIVRNPYGFIRTKDNEGLIRSEMNQEDNDEFQLIIKKEIESIGYSVASSDIKTKTLFPDNNKDFMKMFYDPIRNNILDQNMFTRRIMGMTSCYSSAKKELVPEIRKKEILYIPMSDYMFDKYSIVRKGEIDRDKNSKKSSGKSVGSKGQGKDDIFDVSSSYRAYSRMLCQFVFPEEIPRPFKGDLKDLEVPDEELDSKLALEEEYDEKFKVTKSREKLTKLKEELKEKLKALKNTDKEYDKRLQKALDELDRRRDEFLAFDNGNPEKLSKYSPKYAKIVEEVTRDRKERNKGLKFIYTEYKTSEGVGILSKVLRANGYSPFKIKKDEEGDWVLDFIPGEEKMPKFAVWSGDEESDIILRIYNDLFHLLPDKIRAQVESINKSNRYGKLLEILMTTKQGAEGLNTRNVRQLHVVEPYWNPVRLDQVVGRAVRIGSHMELPKKDRNVDIYIYLSKATKTQIRKNVTMMNDFGGKTSDEVLFDIAEKKREIMNTMLGMMKNSAIDCSINLADNIKSDSNINCMNFGVIANKDSYSYTADINDELKKKERETRVETKKQQFKTLNVIMKGKKIKVSRLEDKIYDFEAVESGRPGNPIGLIFKNQKGKEVIGYY